MSFLIILILAVIIIAFIYSNPSIDYIITDRGKKIILWYTDLNGHRNYKQLYFYIK